MSNVSPSMPAQGTSPGSLPLSLTPILGRDHEIDQVLKWLDRDDLRLVTLLGPGGVGKTRLALEVARRAERDFAHGACFVPLASVRDHTLVPATVARALGVVERPLVPIAEQLKDALRFEHVLLVLDNLEHLAGVASPWLADLLRHCPRLEVLATSRSPLHLTGEQRFLVSPLPVVDQAPGAMPSSPAVELFVQRAQAARPDFELTESNAHFVTAVCHRLDGLPLAIELAAARVNVLPVPEILDRLADQLSLLTPRRHDPVPGLQSMRFAITWSHNLLSPAEQELFRRLAVFMGGFTLDAVVDVCANQEPATEEMTREHAVIDLLGSLVDQSLVARVDNPDGDSRFTMLESVHAYASQQLLAHGEAGTYEARHADWCLRLAERAEQRLVREVDTSWLDVLEAEHDNLRAALGWSLDPGHNLAGHALRMAGALWLFWYYHSHLAEGRRWLEQAVQTSGASNPGDRAKALVGLGNLAHSQGDDDQALGYLTESVAISRALGDRWATAFALSVRGNLSEDGGDYDAARSYFAEANALFEETGDQANVAVTLHHLGIVAYGQGNLKQALDQCASALALAREQNDPWAVANALSYVGLIQVDRKHTFEAANALSEALALYRQIAATERIVDVFRRIAVLAQARGEPHAAVRLFSAADAIGGRTGAVQALPERAAYERATDAARRVLSDGDYHAAWASGQRLSLADALAETNGCLGTGRGAPPVDPAVPEPLIVELSKREIEVLRLMADGLGNQEIADGLFLSHRTVSHHVSSILSKLRVESRTAAVAYAIRNGLA
ncbi:MAG: tetratricopeptide repeat protein [Chloroflexota bacterium]|nr:tetratricopeptide repeat protein [Chloroflexota bacterium]